MIESYVAKARAGESSEEDDLPIIDVSYSPGDARTPVSTMGDTPHSSPGTPSASGQMQSRSGISANRPVGTLDHAPPLLVDQQYPVAKPTRRYARMVVLPVVMISGILLGGIIYSKAHTPAAEPKPVASLEPPVAPAPAPKLAAPPPTPPPQPAANLIEVQVKASPASATIEIDGAQVIGNPFKGRYVNDGAMHQVRVTAPGHVAKTTAVSFESAVALQVDLERVPVARPQPVVHGRPRPVVVAPPPEPVTPPVPEVKPPPPTPKGPTEVDPNGGSKPHHAIDPNNPYAK
jgi:hypothetical protein